MPFTDALHCDMAPVTMEAGEQVTAIDVTVDGAAGCTAMEAVPEMDGVCVLVAVTVTVAAEEGAVKRPLELMVPLPAVQVTADE